MALIKTKAKVVRNEYISKTVFEIDFELKDPIPFEAGQFVMVKFKDPENPEKNMSRSYSVASNPESPVLTLCIKFVEGGKGTTYLSNLKAGDETEIWGPYGRFTYKTQKPRYPFFIATGTGIAPYYSMISSQRFEEFQPTRLTCLLGVRTEDEILYADSFKKLENCEFIPVVSQPNGSWQGFKGRVTHFLKELPYNHDWSLADYYLCGNGAMITEVKEFLMSKGVPKDQVFQEIYFL